MRKNILDLIATRRAAEEANGGAVTAAMVVKDLGSLTPSTSREAALSIATDCKAYGISVRDYLDLSITPVQDGSDRYTGYELALMELNLPVRDDFSNGMVLQAAAETFQTRSGTKLLFKEVVDDIIRWKVRLDNVESAANLISGSRTIDGPEMTVRVTLDDGDADNRGTRIVPEAGRIPVRSLSAGESAVKIYKHGSALRTTYEFNRNTRIDVLTPFLGRIARELEISKASQAMTIMINGDGNNNAAPVVAQSAITGVTGAPANTVGQIQWHRFFRWLMNMAAAGTPIDTVAMNYDAYYQWTMLFSNTSDQTVSASEQLGRAGIDVGRNPIFDQPITPVLSSFAPAGKLIGFRKGETMEELVQANSSIEEEERAILNQTITLTKTENTGYRLIFDDTRSVYDFAG